MANAVRKMTMLKKKLLTDRSGDLQEQMLKEKSQELAHEIDREILWSMLESLGWQRVNLPWPVTLDNLKEIHRWIEQHVKGPHEKNRFDFIFEQAQDAMWFKLRWLG